MLDDEELAWLAFARDRRDAGDPEPIPRPEVFELRMCPECNGTGVEVFSLEERCERCQGRGEA